MGRPGKRYKINNINLYVYLPRVGYIIGKVYHNSVLPERELKTNLTLLIRIKFQRFYPVNYVFSGFIIH